MEEVTETQSQRKTDRVIRKSNWFEDYVDNTIFDENDITTEEEIEIESQSIL